MATFKKSWPRIKLKNPRTHTACTKLSKKDSDLLTYICNKRGLSRSDYMYTVLKQTLKAELIKVK